MKDIVIIMCHHEENDLEKKRTFHQNLQSFYDHNPTIDVITVMNCFKDPREAWLGTDISVFRWYKDNREKAVAERYLIVEWDCWCDCNLREYFSRVWDCDVVVPSIKYPERDDWYWFTTIEQLPEHVREFATGITPFCGILLSKMAMDEIVKEILKAGYSGLNSELRFATIATALNLDPVVNPVCNRTLTWRKKSPLDSYYRGLHHPRKSLDDF